MSHQLSTTEINPQASAFLVMYRGAARLEVVPLQFGQRVTIGRSDANQVIVPDPKCSRHHCELFPVAEQWKLRDLGSRNGVSVDGVRVRDDVMLEFDQKIEIGEVQLSLVHELTPEQEKPLGLSGSDFVITERKSGTLFDRSRGVTELPGNTQPFIDLIQLGREMNDTSSTEELAGLVLERLAEATSAEFGAVLLFPPNARDRQPGSLKETAIHRAQGNKGEGYSDSLSTQVLDSQQAVLAQDVHDHTSLARQDSVQQMRAVSAICAPIRKQGELLGLLHLYSSVVSEPLTPDHLEFALAVADQMGTLLPSIQRHESVIQERDQLESERSDLREQLQIETELIGDSDALEKVKRTIGRVATTDATVLIRGESGVGKELVAREIHFNSLRRTGPFICMNCAALTETLLESELFGHEKGAFTGASNRKAGKFEQAHKGTLFLDEVGEMNPDIQAKFLRVLEEQSFERVGGNETVKVDVRVVTATNRDLEDSVRDGKFRQDLFYRLQVIEIIVPPLRDHTEDIPRIARHFVQKFARRSGLKAQGFNSAAMQMLRAHSWPGNVRELRNVIERAVILSDREVLSPEDIQLSRLAPLETSRREGTGDSAMMSGTTPVGASSIPTVNPGMETSFSEDGLWQSYIDQSLPLDDIDRLYIEAVLERFNWNKSQASRLLGIERTTLDRRLKKYDMSRPDSDDSDNGQDDSEE